MPGPLSQGQIDQFRGIAAEFAFADTYEIVRQTTVSDGMGGSVATDATVEAGDCLLVNGTTRPEERAVADRAGYTTPYTVKMPWDTTLTPDDTLVVNGGRRFDVAGVLRAGFYNVIATAVCQERG